MEKLTTAEYHERRAEQWKNRAEYEHDAKETVLAAIRSLIRNAEQTGAGGVSLPALINLLWEHGEMP